MKLPFFIKISVVLTITLNCVNYSSGGKILFFYAFGSKSHSNVYKPLIDALAAKGHDLTVVTPVKSKTLPSNIKEIIPLPLDKQFKYFNPFDVRKNGKMSIMQYFSPEAMKPLCIKIYEDPEFQKVMEESYDLVIFSAFMNNCFDGILWKLQAPFIDITTMAAPSYITELTGNYLPDSFVPIPFFEFPDKMQFLDRLKNFLMNMIMKIYLGIYNPQYCEIYRKYLGEDAPCNPEAHRNVSAIFMNSHFSLTYPRPNLPDNIEIGGMHCRPAKALPKDIDQFLSDAEDGFVYFSLGSIVRANEMPEEYRKIFVKVFGKLKQRVIWKWETEEMADLPSNVQLRKWLPQQDILGHPKIKLFITHGGLLSTQESVYHGVPVLGIPIFGDQDLNMKQAEFHGYGVKFEILDMTEESLEVALSEMLNNTKYSENAKTLSSVFRDQMETPTERGVWWAEYIMRHKGAHHLRSGARELNYFQIHSWDVIGFLFAIVILILTFLYCIFNFLYLKAIKLLTKSSKIHKD